jgi:dTDP-4-dehydrorhamnose reductase
VSPARAPAALLTGAAGQLGRELQGTAPGAWRVVACDAAALDLTRPEAVEEVVRRERPALIVNAGAFTSVDAAERETERAEAVNSAGAAHLAEAAKLAGARLIHVSTDYVFDGAQSRPYGPADRPHPLGVYGRTKLAGEREVARISGGSALIVRTSWLYSAYGRNFVLTMLRLLRERDAVGVVADQVGSPTWARGLAQTIWAAADRPALAGVHHWSDAGVASWYDFAVAIQEEALALKLLSRAVPIRPLRTEEYPTAARRPGYSVLQRSEALAGLGVPVRHWREQLRTMLREVVPA